MPHQILDLTSLFLGLTDYAPEDALYLKDEPPFSRDTLCIVLNEDEDAAFAIDNGYYAVFSIGLVQEIVLRASEHIPDLTLDEVLDALTYYYNHDDFI
jgi:hypothetical protein